MEERRASISDAEREVLKTLWDHGPDTVREINEVLRKQGRRWAYTTVITLLHRLAAKGYVSSDKSGFAHVFRAAMTRDDFVSRRLADLADDFCDGTAAPLVRALVEGHRFSNEEIEQFRQLIGRLGSGKSSRRNPRPEGKDHGSKRE